MSVSSAWTAAYESNPKGIQAGWRNILGPMSFPREVLVQLPEGKRYNETARTFQEYGRILLENAPRRDCWVSWSRIQDYDVREMSQIYADIDSNVDSSNYLEALGNALTRARKYEEFALETFDVQPTALFSCGKGFHMHLTHDPVPYRGRAYSDALLRLSDKYRVYLDAGPLKHRKAKPRVPYSINLKATGREMAPMFVVPVDLTWDLKEIIQAAKECRITPFKIPHSTEAAKVITPLAKQGHEREEAMAKKRIASGKGVDMDRIKAILTFCEENGPNMVDGRGRPDGRKRLLYAVYVPALLHWHRGDQSAVLEACKAWVEACGGAWGVYQPIVTSTMRYCLKDGGDLLQPMGIPRWLGENPNLRFPSS